MTAGAERECHAWHLAVVVDHGRAVAGTGDKGRQLGTCTAGNVSSVAPKFGRQCRLYATPVSESSRVACAQPKSPRTCVPARKSKTGESPRPLVASPEARESPAGGPSDPLGQVGPLQLPDQIASISRTNSVRILIIGTITPSAFRCRPVGGSCSGLVDPAGCGTPHHLLPLRDREDGVISVATGNQVAPPAGRVCRIATDTLDTLMASATDPCRHVS